MKKKTNKFIRNFFNIHHSIFLIVFIVAISFATIQLRHNNQNMIKLREAVFAADKDNSDVNKALNDLRDYVYGHMNTNISSGNNTIKPPIQLKYTYQRLYDEQVAKNQALNASIYTEAQNYCQHQNQSLYSTTVPCVQSYVADHSLSSGAINIPAGLYQFDFLSPSWSPDGAGWGLAVAALSFIGFILSFGLQKLSRPLKAA